MSQYREIKNSFRYAVRRDVADVLDDIRSVDATEMAAASGPDIEKTLYRAFDEADEVATCYEDRGVICLFGLSCRDLMATTGVPWLIGTNLMQDHSATALRAGREYMRAALDNYDKLENYVDARNRWSIVYLKRIGFTLDEAAPFGVAQLPFHRFHMRPEDV